MISESERKTTWSPSQRNLQGDSSSEAQWYQYMKNNIELNRLQKSFQVYGAVGLNIHSYCSFSTVGTHFYSIIVFFNQISNK